MMSEGSPRGQFGNVIAVFAVACAILAAIFVFFARPLQRYVRESLMQSTTSAHYRILCPPGALSQKAMTRFTTQREPLFLSLDRKLDDVASNSNIRLIFDPDFKTADTLVNSSQVYEVIGTTIRTRLTGLIPQLDPAADAEALLNIAWGKSGSPLIAHWTAIWLVGQWQGQELGMAAAEVEHRLGHRKVANLLGQPPDATTAPEDRALLGAAWLNAIAELAGPAEVRKLYSAKMTKLDVTEVTKALGTTPTELERNWQMWIYAYIAGMPAAPHPTEMPMDMPMSK